MNAQRRLFKDSSQSLRTQREDSRPIGYRGEGRGDSTPHQSPSVAKATGSVAPTLGDFSYLMGVCREVGLTNMRLNGSVLKRLLKSHKCGALESVVRGLPLVIDGCDSLLPLNSTKHGDDIWARAAQAYGQSIKEETPKPKETDEGPQRLDFSRFTAA